MIFVYLTGDANISFDTLLECNKNRDSIILLLPYSCLNVGSVYFSASKLVTSVPI